MKPLLTLLLSLTAISSSIAASDISFGEKYFLVDDESTGYNYDYNTDGYLTLTGYPSSQLFGTLIDDKGDPTSVDWRSYFNDSSSSPQITLTASITSTSNVDSSFNIYFYDSAGGYALYSGNWSSFSSTLSTQTLTYEGSYDNFSGEVSSISINGSGDYTVTITLDSLSISASAIPEPTTYAALAGLAVLGMAVWNRRSTRSLQTTA